MTINLPEFVIRPIEPKKAEIGVVVDLFDIRFNRFSLSLHSGILGGV